MTTPECLTLGEQCPVEADKALGVGAAMVQLPVGWTYARSTDRLTAVSADAGATIAFAAAANGTREAIRSALYALLAEHAITGVVDDAVSLEKPQVTWPAGDLSVQAWQVEKPKRGQSVQKEDPLLRGQPGALLVGVTRISEDQVVVGIGFLLRSAPTTFAQPIKDCLTSLRTEVAPAGAVGK